MKTTESLLTVKFSKKNPVSAAIFPLNAGNGHYYSTKFCYPSLFCYEFAGTFLFFRPFIGFCRENDMNKSAAREFRLENLMLQIVITGNNFERSKFFKSKHY